MEDVDEGVDEDIDEDVDEDVNEDVNACVDEGSEVEYSTESVEALVVVERSLVRVVPGLHKPASTRVCGARTAKATRAKTDRIASDESLSEKQS